MRKKENPKYRKNKHVPLVTVPVPDDLITYLEPSEEKLFRKSLSPPCVKVSAESATVKHYGTATRCVRNLGIKNRWFTANRRSFQMGIPSG